MADDILIIGAGLSGLAAGVRLAHFGRRVLVCERHSVSGGLNSWYRRGGREVDTGLHAMTNFVPASDRQAPLNVMLRQLRLSREELNLRPQTASEVRFPGAALPFTNDPAVLEAAIAGAFPADIDGYRRLAAEIRAADPFSPANARLSARTQIGRFVRSPQLLELLLCPILFYGGYAADDVDWDDGLILFRSLFLEGLSRPAGGIRPFLARLAARLDERGGTLRLRCGVRKLTVQAGRVVAVTLDDGTELAPGAVLSTIGWPETWALLDTPPAGVAPPRPGEVAFVETILTLDRTPAELGISPGIAFISETEHFHYGRPAVPVDDRSLVLCAPDNFGPPPAGPAPEPCRTLRVTRLADFAPWFAATPEQYRTLKAEALAAERARIERRFPGLRGHVLEAEMFTPRTVGRFTGRQNGAIYGSPDKCRSGRTPLANLYLAGTDQGFLGIVGSLLSGIAVANRHLLRPDGMA